MSSEDENSVGDPSEGTMEDEMEVDEGGSASDEDEGAIAAPESREGGADAVTFESFGLDQRILRAIAKLGWRAPTPIQAHAIPLALEGKDLLSRARTGSGKTGAYAIPVIQRIIHGKSAADDGAAGVRAVVLVPSKELCKQARQNFRELAAYCARDISVVDLGGEESVHAQRPMLLERPDIIVSTPSRLVAHIDAGNVDLKESLEMLVIDEADMLFSYGYEDDVRRLVECIPRICQCFLMSATMSDDVDALRRLVLHNPAVLKLSESPLPEAARLKQFLVRCEDDDKFLIAYTLIKLRILRGKTIVFVNDTDRCYRLRLFLEQFAVRSCVLNPELPQNSRQHIVHEFNRGVYDIVIASDQGDHDEAEAGPEPPAKRQKVGAKKSVARRKQDDEYAVARGVDFREVENVVNFDFPRTAHSYIHRVGRTARGDRAGQALSFVSIADESRLQEVEAALGAMGSEHVIQPYTLNMAEIEPFRYRVTDALRAVTKAAIKEARLKEIRAEILNSEKLKAHFEDNPRDLEALRHDKALHPARVQPHLRHVPSYLMPNAVRRPGQGAPRGPSSRGGSRGRPSVRRGGAAQRGKGAARGRGQGDKKRKEDPLKTFKFG